MNVDVDGLPAEIRSRSDLKIFLEMDLLAHGQSVWRAHHRFTKPELYYQRRLRKAEYWRTKAGRAARLVYAFQRARLLQQSVRTGISVPPGSCGPGLSIAHYGSVVVNAEARLGAFCRLHSATNIGSLRGSAPQLGHFVYVGPGAALFGDIHVGTAAVIGANAVVDKDVPAGHMAVGAPAKSYPADPRRTPMPPWIQHMMGVDGSHREEDTL